MKLSKFLSVVGLITAISLLYVYQQTEIFRLAYLAQKQQALFQELLDKNCILRYNMEKGASLINLSSVSGGDSDFEMPDSYRLVRLRNSYQGSKVKIQSSSSQTLLSRLFGIKAQAEAKTINP